VGTVMTQVDSRSTKFRAECMRPATIRAFLYTERMMRVMLPADFEQYSGDVCRLWVRVDTGSERLAKCHVPLLSWRAMAGCCEVLARTEHVTVDIRLGGRIQICAAWREDLRSSRYNTAHPGHRSASGFHNTPNPTHKNHLTTARPPSLVVVAR